MSQKEKSTKTTKTWSQTKILDFLAYFAIVFIAIALILRLALKQYAPSVSNAFGAIGECLAYCICIWLGFYWTRRKQNIWWTVGGIVATVVIVVVYIFNVI